MLSSQHDKVVLGVTWWNMIHLSWQERHFCGAISRFSSSIGRRITGAHFSRLTFFCLESAFWEYHMDRDFFDFICQDLLGKMTMGMYCDEKDGHDLECATGG